MSGVFRHLGRYTYGQLSVGGLAGDNDGGDILRSYATGAVSAVSGETPCSLGSHADDSIAASYASGSVSGNSDVGGLVGSSAGANDSIFASYARGAVCGSSNASGLVGKFAGGIGDSITDSYSLYSTGRVFGIGNDDSGIRVPGEFVALEVDGLHNNVVDIGDNSLALQTGGQNREINRLPSYTSLVLRAPTGYSGIYATWNIDVDGDDTADNPWDFGANADYPKLLNVGGTQTSPASTSTVDYDSDNDGLIDIDSLAGLNAIRWDMNGDGVVDPAESVAYAAGFLNHVLGMGCPSGGCTGYELMADLDFDTDGDDTADSGDTYWDGRKGWHPIGGLANVGASAGFSATFEGNNNTISNLFIDRGYSSYEYWAGYRVGLFGLATGNSVIRNLDLTDVDVSGDEEVGALVGSTADLVDDVTVTGRVTGESIDVGGVVGLLMRGSILNSGFDGAVTGSSSHVGGLVGGSLGTIRYSYAKGTVTGDTGYSTIVGGLAGSNSGTIAANYAANTVTANSGFWVGGLVGQNGGQYTRGNGMIIASYSSGNVSAGGDVGGLVGSNYGTVSYTWSTGSVNRQGSGASGGLVGANEWENHHRRYAIANNSYWNSDATGWSFGISAPDDADGDNVVDSGETNTLPGHTAAQLQAPTGYSGIYATWNIDVDGDGTNDDPWCFGTSSDFPSLRLAEESDTCPAGGASGQDDGASGEDGGASGEGDGQPEPVSEAVETEPTPVPESAQQVSSQADVASIRITSTPVNANVGYQTGDRIVVAVVFDAAVDVDHDPWPILPITIGSNNRTSNCFGLSLLFEDRDTTLICRYYVQSGDRDIDGTSIDANSLSLNGGGITTKSSGNAANISHDAVDASQDQQVSVNRPPTANAGANRRVDTGASVTLRGSGSDLDGDSLTYQWTQTGGTSVTLSSANSDRSTFTAPSSPASLVFSLVVNDGTVDSAPGTVAITVGGGSGGDGQQPAVDVYPTFGRQSVDDVIFAIRGAGTTVTLPAARGGNGPLTYSLSPAKEGLSFDAEARTVTGTRAVEETLYTLRAVDTDGDRANLFLSITVDIPNRASAAPALTAQTALTGVAYSYVFAAVSDPDGDTVTYSATQSDGTALPDWLTQIPGEREFRGTPQDADAGRLSIKVTASDGELSASATFTLVIDLNRPPPAPQLTTGQSVFTGVAYSYAFAAVSDPNGSPVTYSAAKSDGSDLPDWLSFNAATRQFSGAPQLDDTGTLTVEVTASDGLLSSSATFTLEVSVSATPPGVLGKASNVRVLEYSGGNVKLTWRPGANANIHQVRGTRQNADFSHDTGDPVVLETADQAGSHTVDFSGMGSGRYYFQVRSGYGPDADSVTWEEWTWIPFYQYVLIW